MAQGYTARALILNMSKFRENDRIVTVLSKDYGKLRLLVRGAAKPSSKLVGLIQTFDLVSLDIYRGRSLDGIRGGEVLQSFGDLRTDPKRLGHAYCMAELANYLAQENEPDGSLYLLLLTCLRLLKSTDNISLISVFFLIRLTKVAGVMPILDTCVQCKSQSASDIYISYNLGGVICRSCGPVHRRYGAPISKRQLSLARYLLQVHPREVLQTNASEQDLNRLFGVFVKFMEFHLDRRVNSRAFLDILG